MLFEPSPPSSSSLGVLLKEMYVPGLASTGLYGLRQGLPLVIEVARRGFTTCTGRNYRKNLDPNTKKRIKLLHSEVERIRTSGRAGQMREAKVLMHLGELYLRTTQFRDAEVVFRRAHAIKELHDTKVEVAKVALCLGCALRGRGNIRAANALFRGAVAELAWNSLEDPFTAEAVVNLAHGLGFRSGKVNAVLPQGVMLAFRNADGLKSEMMIDYVPVRNS